MSTQSVTQTRDTSGDVSPQLDGGTQLVVALNWYPEAGEAVAYLGAAPLTPEQRAEARDRRLQELALLGPELAAAEALRRDLENRERAARRARSRVRRYVVANGCTRMVTLTYAPREPVPGRWSTGGPPNSAEVVHGPGTGGRCRGCGRPIGPDGVRAAMKDAATWIRRLRLYLGGDRMPYVLVPEYHEDMHVHLHVLLDRYVEHDLLEQSWGLGFVHIGKARDVAGRGAREAARKAARYASKYVGKAFDEGAPGRHRYEVGEGFQPWVVKRSGYRSLEQAVTFCEDHGQVVTHAVHSDGLQDYSGPPFLWVALESSS